MAMKFRQNIEQQWGNDAAHEPRVGLFRMNVIPKALQNAIMQMH